MVIHLNKHINENEKNVKHRGNIYIYIYIYIYAYESNCVYKYN